jgi:signal transduction histidine kinase
MRQRAGAIGGEWQIDSQPGAGTRISVRLLKQAS